MEGTEFILPLTMVIGQNTWSFLPMVHVDGLDTKPLYPYLLQRDSDQTKLLVYTIIGIQSTVFRSSMTEHIYHIEKTYNYTINPDMLYLLGGRIKVIKLCYCVGPTVNDC